jgi:hypothetical protein
MCGGHETFGFAAVMGQQNRLLGAQRSRIQSFFSRQSNDRRLRLIPTA